MEETPKSDEGAEAGLRDAPIEEGLDLVTGIGSAGRADLLHAKDRSVTAETDDPGRGIENTDRPKVETKTRNEIMIVETGTRRTGTRKTVTVIATLPVVTMTGVHLLW